jgi:hypothetical protein
MSWIKDFAVPAICLIACAPLAAMAWNQNGPSTRSDSEQDLRVAEANAMQALRGWNQGATTAQESMERLKSSSSAFRVYREAQCGFRLSLDPQASREAMGSEMNICAYQLNQDRITHLNTTVSDLPQR